MSMPIKILFLNAMKKINNTFKTDSYHLLYLLYLSTKKGSLAIEFLTNLDNYMKKIKKMHMIIKKINIFWEMKIKNIQILKYPNNIVYLDISRQRIIDTCVLKYCVNLKYLNLNSNQVTSLKYVSYLTELNTLLCGYNFITNLDPIKLCKKLKIVECSSNRLDAINIFKYLKDLEEFTYVNLNNKNNKKYKCLKFIGSLSQNTKLKKLDLDLTSVTYLRGIKNCTRLRKLLLWNENKLDIQMLADIIYLKIFYKLQIVRYDDVGRYEGSNIEEVD